MEERSKSGGIFINLLEIKKTKREYYEQLDTNKLDYLDEIGTFLEIYKLAKLSEGKAGNLN